MKRNWLRDLEHDCRCVVAHSKDQIAEILCTMDRQAGEAVAVRATIATVGYTPESYLEAWALGTLGGCPDCGC